MLVIEIRRLSWIIPLVLLLGFCSKCSSSCTSTADVRSRMALVARVPTRTWSKNSLPARAPTPTTPHPLKRSVTIFPRDQALLQFASGLSSTYNDSGYLRMTTYSSSYGSLATTFPANICAFGPAVTSALQCYLYDTCTHSNGVLCCAQNDQCTQAFTACTEIFRDKFGKVPTTDSHSDILTCYRNSGSGASFVPITATLNTLSTDDSLITLNILPRLDYPQLYAPGEAYCNVYIVSQTLSAYFCGVISSYHANYKDWPDGSLYHGATQGYSIILTSPSDILQSNPGVLLRYRPGSCDLDIACGEYLFDQSCSIEGTQCVLGTSTIKIPPVPTNPAEWLNNINSGAPPCVDSMASLCPNLYSSLQTAIKGVHPEADFCSDLAATQCPGLCLNGSSPVDYLSWIMGTCNKTGLGNYTSFESSWVDYQVIAEASYQSFFPWKWKLVFDSAELKNGTTSTSLSNNCSGVEEKLLSFAVVNVVVLVASTVLGRRDVIYKLSRGRLGKKGSRAWPWMALLTVTLHVMSNVCNALLTQKVPGFHHVPFAGLFLLWSSRPRLSWVAALLMPIQKKDSIYFGLGVAALISEMILQGIGSVYLGMTVNRAAQYHYYLRSHLDHVPNRGNALIMYTGSLIWIVAVGSALSWGILVFSPIGRILHLSFLSACNKTLTPLIWIRGYIYIAYHWFRAKALRGWHWLKRQILSALRWLNTMLVNSWRLCLNRPLHVRSERRTIVEEPPPSYYEATRGQPRAPGALERYRERMIQRMHDIVAEARSGTEWDTPEARKQLTWDRSLLRMGFTSNVVTRARSLVLMLLFPWIGQWLFWIGFVRLAGDNFCPPKLWTNTTVWTVFSTLAAFLAPG